MHKHKALRSWYKEASVYGLGTAREENTFELEYWANVGFVHAQRGVGLQRDWPKLNAIRLVRTTNPKPVRAGYESDEVVDNATTTCADVRGAK